MKLLLDTHTALWWWADPDQLGRKACQLLQAPDSLIHFSAASAFEIQQKVRVGKLVIPATLSDEGLSQAAVAEGWVLLGLDVPSASLAAAMEHSHRDPFDRMLAALAIRHHLTLVTRNPIFASFPIKVIW